MTWLKMYLSQIPGISERICLNGIQNLSNCFREFTLRLSFLTVLISKCFSRYLIDTVVFFLFYFTQGAFQSCLLKCPLVMRMLHVVCQ